MSDFLYGRQIHPVEYLESTGTQYINTLFNGKSGLKTVCKFNFTELTTNVSNAIGGEYKPYVSCYIGMVRTNGKFAYHYYNTTIEGTTASINTDYVLESYMYPGEQYLMVNGVKIATSTMANSFTSDVNIWLFGMNISGGVPFYSKMKMYYCQIYDNGTLVRDFIPAIDSEGRGFMFDRVTHTIYDNAGTGNFAYPPVEVEYIESTGTQYINTGYNPNSNTKVEAKFKMNETANTFKWLFSSRNQALAGDGYGFGSVANGFIDSEYNSRVSSTTDKLTNGTVYTIVKDKNVCRYNDSVLINPESTFTVNHPLPIFALNNTGTIEVSSYTIANCYYFKIYDNDILVRDLIPCYKDSALGMWDKANAVFYPNAGTGTFTTSKIVEPEYE